MTLVSNLLHNRELKRKRFVAGFGWVTSSDFFMCRIQPKFVDSENRVIQITSEELFMHNAIYRDNNDDDGASFIETSYTFPTSAESYQNALSGIELVAGDRIIEESSGRLWIVRAIGEFRDNRLKHDEIICSEASHLDRKWIEPIKVLTISGTETFDSLFNNYSEFKRSNYEEQNVVGALAYYDDERYTRDTKMVIRSAKGKIVDEKIVLYIDADYNVDEKSLFEFRDRIWKVNFITESFFRVYRIGLSPFMQEDANETLIKRPTQTRYV